MKVCIKHCIFNWRRKSFQAQREVIFKLYRLILICRDRLVFRCKKEHKAQHDFSSCDKNDHRVSLIVFTFSLHEANKRKREGDKKNEMVSPLTQIFISKRKTPTFYAI